MLITHRRMYYRLFATIQIILSVLFIYDNNAYAFDFKNPATTSALAPTSRFTPIVTLEYKDGRYVIREDKDAEPGFDDTRKTFEEDTAFVYINLLMGQFLYKLSDLGKLGVSKRGLQESLEREKREHLELFIQCINDHFPAAKEKFGRFHFDEMFWDDNAILLPYSSKNPKDDESEVLNLYYYLPGHRPSSLREEDIRKGVKEVFETRISTGGSQYVILEETQKITKLICRAVNPVVGPDVVETENQLPVKIFIKDVERKGLVLSPEKGKEEYILNAGVLSLEGRCFLFTRRAVRSDNLVYHSEIGLFEHLESGQTRVIDREVLVPRIAEDTIALEDARVIEKDGIIYVYMTAVKSNRSCYPVVTTHSTKEFLEIIRSGRKDWNWSPLTRLINDGPCANQNIKSFIPFGNAVEGKNFALYRPNEKGGSTIRMAVSENGLTGPWKDAGEYHSIPQGNGWLGPSAYVSGLPELVKKTKYDFMLYHRATIRPEDSSKYYDIRLIVTDKDNPRRRYMTEPLLVPDLSNPLERDGWIPGAIYTCGAVLKSFDEKTGDHVFDIYYSGADSVVMLAAVTVNISDVSEDRPPLAITAEAQQAAMLADTIKICAKEEQKNILIAIATDQAAPGMRSVVEAIDDFAGTLKLRGMLGNVNIVHADDPATLLTKITDEKEKFNISFGNIIVIGSREKLNHEKFKVLRENKAFFANISFTNTESLFDIIQVILKCAFDKEKLEAIVGQHPELVIKALGEREIYVEAKPVDTERLDYRRQIDELKKQA